MYAFTAIFRMNRFHVCIIPNVIDTRLESWSRSTRAM